MTRFLVATAARATTAAACDYLDGRVESGDDVYVVTVAEDDEGERDVGFDTVRARLGDRATVRTLRYSGTPARVVVGFARERDIDEIILGPRRGGADGEGASTLGSTTRAVLTTVDLPVFVVGL